MIAKDEYAGFGAVPDDLIPCSDGAGEVVAIGPGVTRWAVGDRVVANFCQDYVGAGPRVELLESALGGAIHGVLTEYRTFPEHVRRVLLPYMRANLTLADHWTGTC